MSSLSGDTHHLPFSRCHPSRMFERCTYSLHRFNYALECGALLSHGWWNKETPNIWSWSFHFRSYVKLNGISEPQLIELLSHSLIRTYLPFMHMYVSMQCTYVRMYLVTTGAVHICVQWAFMYCMTGMKIVYLYLCGCCMLGMNFKWSAETSW